MTTNERWTIACFSRVTDKMVDEILISGDAETFRRIFNEASVDEMIEFDHAITDAQRGALEAIMGRSIPIEDADCFLGVMAVDE